MSDKTELATEIYNELVDYYGEPDPPKNMSGVDYLIETILSQNTNDGSRDKAFKRLRKEFDSYRQIENAPQERVADLIRVCGLGPTKAKRIQDALRAVRQRNDGYNMEFIDDMNTEDAKVWLTGINGIGPKTAAVILCFHFNKPIIPVDTHVERLSKRFGLVPHNYRTREVQDELNDLVPDEIKYEFHMLLIQHGREHCKARNPTCGESPLRKYCSYYQQVIRGGVSEEYYPLDSS